VAAWFLIFSIPIFVTTRDTPRASTGSIIVGPFQELWRTAKEIGRFREAAKFLAARLIYNDAS
jgi:MFS-type transporter involved in bile tolerance (Atg22 family)